jgi:phosphatidate phosphatase APP1
VRLLEPEGQSVISDIDDTVKVSEVPAGKAILARNTFLRDFVAAPGMQTRYQALADAAFHYVSGSPWQLHRPLSRFLIDESRFPAGSFHFKELRGHALTAMRSLEDLANFANPEGTVTHKVDQISRIMKRFPARRFILIGDSGERDPEVYREIVNTFGAQVREVLIRDVVNARQIDSGRLAGMTVIEAPTVVPGVSMLPA